MTPYGSLNWRDLGNDKWEQRINLTPEGQGLLDQDQKTSQGLANLQDTATGRVAAQQARGYGDENLPPSPFNPGETAQDAIMRRMQPQLDRSRAATENRLANQGIALGSEAYKNAQTDIGQQENDAYSQAALQGISAGQQGRQQGIQEQQYFNSRDMNQLNALRTGSQVQNPQFSNYAQQQTTAGPNLLGAAESQYGAGLDRANAKNKATGDMFGNLTKIGVAMLSDRRLKSSIKPIGRFNGHNWYSYIKFGRHEIGVMAQEVMQTNPGAVHMHESGYLMVDYGAL